MRTKLIHHSLVFFAFIIFPQLILSCLHTNIADAYLLVSSSNTSNILRYSATDGSFIDEFVSAGSGGLVYPRGLTIGPDGNLYVCSLNHSVIRYNAINGSFIDVFVPPGRLQRPAGLTFGPDDNLYVSSYDTDEVLRYDGKTGAFLDVFATENGMIGPWGLTFGPDGHLYVGIIGGKSRCNSTL